MTLRWYSVNLKTGSVVNIDASTALRMIMENGVDYREGLRLLDESSPEHPVLVKEDGRLGVYQFQIC